MARQAKTQKVEVLDQEVCARWYDVLAKHFEKDLIFFREALQASTEEKIRLLFASIAYYELQRVSDFPLATARSKTSRGLGDWYIYKKTTQQESKKPSKDLLQ